MKIDWTPLQEHEDENLWRGCVFRFPARHPFEDVVDFMLVADAGSDSGFSLICATGYKAGHRECQLPREALASGQVQAISKRWLLANWQLWVYPETDASKVLVCSGYPPGVGGLG